MVENVTYDDAGIYECHIKDGYGWKYFRKMISVYSLPIFLNDVVKVETTIGSNVTFPCFLNMMRIYQI